MRVDLLYPEECAAIERALKGQYKTIWIIGLSTGLRISDILRLRLSDFEKDRFYIKEKKTGKLRRVYVRKRTRKAVNDYIQTRSSVCSDKLFSVSRQAVWESFKRAGRRAEIHKNIGTHTMRKSYSVGHLRKGFDLDDLQHRLNHSKVCDTIGYITSNSALGLDEYGRKRRTKRKARTQKGKK